MKKMYLVVVAVVVFFIVAVVGFAIYDGKFASNVDIHEYNNILNQEITDSYNFIEINTTSADISFEKSDTTKVVVDGTSNKATAEVINGVLSIKYDNSNCSIAFCSGDIKVYMPDTVKSITINSRNSDITAYDLPNTNLDMTMNNGDIKLGKIDSFSVVTNNGDISVKEINKRVDIVTNNGDIELGNVNITENSSIKTNMGDVEILNIKDVDIVGSTSLGERIINNSVDSSVKLTIKTNVGDIEVNK